MYKEKKFKNGLRLITAPMKGTKTATILVMVGAGSKYETKNNNGISHFLEHAFFKGTEKRSDTLAISSELDSVGGEFNAFTSKEYTGYYVKVDSKKLEKATDIVSDMLINSKFEEEEIQREKGVIIEEINMYHDNPMMHIDDVFEECLYGDTPAGWEIIGPKSNIEKFNRKYFIDYLKSHYGAKNVVICVAGNIKPSETEKMIDKYFNNLWDNKVEGKKKVIEKQTKPQARTYYKKTGQATFSLGVRTFPLGHKDEMIVRLMSIVLGGSMSSRLFIKLRERSGLAYFVRTQSETYTDSGYITTMAGVPVDKVNQAIEIILEEYKNLKEELVSQEELKRAKDMIHGRMVIQLESSDNIANWYAKQAVLRGNFSSPEEFFKKINAVTDKDIKRVANNIFNEKGLNLGIIGPYKDDKRFINLLSF